MKPARPSAEYPIVISHLTAPSDDRLYWWAQSPDARLAAVETMRQTLYGYDPAPDRLQRLLEITQRTSRLGLAPFRIKISTTISGVDFADCYARRIVAEIDGIAVPVIDLGDLRKNKKASGRYKDLDDLENLPGVGDT